jgi:hypothetical protein
LIEEHPDHVDLTLQRKQAIVPPGVPWAAVECTLVGYERRLEITLPSPLAGRPLHDTYQSRGARPVFDLAAGFTIDPLPDGLQYVLDYAGGSAEHPTLTRGYHLDVDPASSTPRSFPAQSRAASNLLITQSEAGHNVDASVPDGEPEATTVHGTTAERRSDERGTSIEWTVSGRTMRVVWWAYPGVVPPPPDQLRTIAEAVTLPR